MGTEHPLNIDDLLIFGKDMNDTEFQYKFITKPTTSSPSKINTPSTPKNEISHIRSSQMTATPLLDATNSQNSQNSQGSFGHIDASMLKEIMNEATKDILNEQKKQYEAKLM